MAEDLVEQCSKLVITNGEDDIVDLDTSNDEHHVPKLSLQLVGRILTSKPLNFDAVRRTLLHIWSLKKGVVIRAMESNLFLFQFFHWKDVEKVLKGRPWSFENKLLVIQEIDHQQQPTDMVLNHSPFWIRLYNLPFGFRSDKRVESIAKAIGEVMEIEEDFLDVNPFRRVRVRLDITKPLKRHQLIRVQKDTTMKIPLKYEMPPHFCFLCGLLCHTDKDCSQLDDEEKEKDYSWGTNIRASPRKGLSKHVEEINTLKSRKNLFVPRPPRSVLEGAGEGATSLEKNKQGQKGQESMWSNKCMGVTPLDTESVLPATVRTRNRVEDDTLLLSHHEGQIGNENVTCINNAVDTIVYTGICGGSSL